MSSGNGFLIFGFLLVLLFRVFRCFGRWFGGLVLPSPFLAWQRPRCLIGGCFEAVGVVGAAVAEDRAERRPNMRNKSSIFRYRGAYLVYRSATVKQFLYVGGGGEITRYCGGGEGNGDGGSDALFSSGWGDGEGEDFDEHVGEHAVEDRGEDVGEDAGCLCFGHFSRRC